MDIDHGRRRILCFGNLTGLGRGVGLDGDGETVTVVEDADFVLVHDVFPFLVGGFFMNDLPDNRSGRSSCSGFRGHDLVDQTVFDRFGRRHEEVAVGVAFDRLQRLAGVLDENVVEHAPQTQDLAALDLDISRRALCTAPGLMDHDPRMRQCEPFSCCAGRQQDCAHAGTLAETVGLDIAGNGLDGIVDGQSGRDRAARAVDVQADLFVRRFRLQEQQLGDDQVGGVVIDRGSEHDDPVFEQAGENVIPAFSGAGIFHYHRNQLRFDRFVHDYILSLMGCFQGCIRMPEMFFYKTRQWQLQNEEIGLANMNEILKSTVAYGAYPTKTKCFFPSSNEIRLPQYWSQRNLPFSGTVAILKIF